MITLYPWPRNMILSYGPKQPSNRLKNEAKKYNAEVKRIGNEWVSIWNQDGLRKFYIQDILYHEVGHHVDFCSRHFSDANDKQVEEFADQYAFARTATTSHIYDKLNNSD